MSLLVTSRDLFNESPFPIVASSIENRALRQNELHRHEFFEILYVARGELQNSLSNETLSLVAGDLLVIKPYVRHLITTRSDNPVIKAYCCSFLPQIVDQSIKGIEDVRRSNSPNRYYFESFLRLADNDVSASLIRVAPKQRKRIEKLFQSVEGNSADKSMASHARLRCNFLNLLATLSDYYNEEQSDPDPASQFIQVSSSRYHEGLRKALSYIHAHMEEPLTLTQMAEMSGVSVSYFSMLMKHSTGMSFINYLNGLRMDEASALLRSSSDNIMDICYKVGFNDYSHFSRKFKKITGLTPREFRQRKGHKTF